jgi:hypothetical protein
MGHCRIALLAVLALVLIVPIPVNATDQPLRTISLDAPPLLLAHPVSRNAINDTIALLRRSFPHTTVNRTTQPAQVRIVLILDTGPVTAPVRPTPTLLPYPAQSYHWQSRHTARGTTLVLTAPSAQGISFGLYGLLQEKLGFRFIHPRQTLIPQHRHWPLPPRFTWDARPRFEKRGFHLHTLHPTELTEQLTNPAVPGALAEIRHYLDWLARNQQNVMQFYLLRTMDQQQWPRHARAVVAYAHERGIKVGAAFSLAMIQQQALQTIKPLRFYRPYRRQVDTSLAWLFQVPWDFVTIEPTLGEHLPDLGMLLPKTRSHLVRTITETYRTPLFFATHVIQRRQDSTSAALQQSGTGSLIHTVMNYGVTDREAPVYGNSNLRFILDRIRRERVLRETWYWPESSYWVTYDNSVPLLLLTYLDARWTDMNIMAEQSISGHLTFSSGWEWGYWLIDWSIARWSWQYRENGRLLNTTPTSCLDDLFPEPELAGIWRRALDLENEYVKQRGLIAYLAAVPPFAELPRFLSKPFQPTPPFTYRRLFRQASRDEATAAVSPIIADLHAYSTHLEQLCSHLNRSVVRHYTRNSAEPRLAIARELYNGLAVTALRARHRALTLEALLLLKRGPARNPAARHAGLKLLADAAAVRRQALTLVADQERHYRYSPDLIARRRTSMTAYQFGYLYPVSNLFFWEREEAQIRAGRFDPFFMNLWDFQRVLGLDSLW